MTTAMNKLKVTLFSIACFFSLQALAQQNENENEKAWYESVSLSGYLDAYYTCNFNDPKSSRNQGRIFDVYHNTFSLGLIQAKVQYTSDKLDIVADITAGPNADLGNFGNAIGSSILIKQAYMAYEIIDNLVLTVGQYGTHIGYELIDAPENFNYSLSYLFGNGPFYHTGVKLDYAIGDNFGVMAGLVNGWDELVDFNKGKSVTLQSRFILEDNLAFYLNWIGGDESKGLSGFGEYEGSYTSLLDLTASWQTTDKFKVGLNTAWGSFQSGANSFETGVYSRSANWWGTAIYLNYDVSDVLGLGLRTEKFVDESGVRYFGPVNATAFTLTGDIRLANQRLIIKPEFRYDHTQENFFEDHNGNLVKQQTSFGIAFIGKY